MNNRSTSPSATRLVAAFIGGGISASFVAFHVFFLVGAFFYFIPNIENGVPVEVVMGTVIGCTVVSFIATAYTVVTMISPDKTTSSRPE